MPTNSSPSTQAPSQTVASEFHTVTGLAGWSFWLATLSITCVFVVMVCWMAPGLIDEMMYTVIVGLGLITLASSFQVARDLDRQTRLAGDQVKILEHVSSFEDFLQRTETTPSVFRTHIANLYDIALSHTDVTQDRLIEVLHSRLRARNRVNDLFASILTTLGLIGTIVGLVLMMGRLSEQIRGASGNAQQLMERIFDPVNGALSGLGIAFITTLLGAVLGGIFLRVLTSVVDANITHYTGLIAELTEVYVLPSIRSLAERQADERRKEADDSAGEGDVGS